MDGDKGRLARCPPTGRIGDCRGRPALSRGRQPVDSSVRVYKDPFPHPALRDGVIPRLLSGVGRAMAIARLTHLRLSIPSSGSPAGRVPME